MIDLCGGNHGTPATPLRARPEITRVPFPPFTVQAVEGFDASYSRSRPHVVPSCEKLTYTVLPHADAFTVTVTVVVAVKPTWLPPPPDTLNDPQPPDGTV